MTNPEMSPESIGEGKEEFESMSEEQRERGMEASHIEANKINEKINTKGEWDKLRLEEGLASLAGDEQRVGEIAKEKKELVDITIENFDERYGKILEKIKETIPEIPDVPQAMPFTRNIPGLNKAVVDMIGALGNYDIFSHDPVRENRANADGVVLGQVKNNLVLLSNDGVLKTECMWGDVDTSFKIEKRADYYKNKEKEAEAA